MEWKELTEFPGYLINMKGDIKSLKGNGHPNSSGEKIRKPNLDPKGYYSIIFSENCKIKKRLVHRLVAQAFIPNPEGKPTVDHINRIKTDNRVENLRWATWKEQNINRSSKC